MKVPTVCRQPVNEMGQICGSKDFTRIVQGTYFDRESVSIEFEGMRTLELSCEPDLTGEWECSQNHAQTQDETWRDL